MPLAEGYKLRLGDGTTFSVDEKGLLTWLEGGLVDSKARVQPTGSRKWYSVQQVLAAERATAERPAVEREAADRAAAKEAAATERRVAEDRAATERKAAEEREAAARKAAEQAAAAERRAAEKREAAEWRAAEERASAERVAAEERAGAQRRAEADDFAAVLWAKAHQKEPRAAVLDADKVFEPRATEIPLEPLAASVKETAFEGDLESFQQELELRRVEWPDADVPAGGRAIAGSAERVASVEGTPDKGRGEPFPEPPPRTEPPSGLAKTFIALGTAVIWVFVTVSPMIAEAAIRSVRALRWLKRRAAARPGTVSPAVAVPTPMASAPKSAAPVAPTMAAPSPRPAPPLAFHELPVIPFAESPREARVNVEEAEDGWEDGEPSASSMLLETVWVWLKRATITAALVTTAVLLAVNTDAWLPRANTAAIIMSEQLEKLQTRVAPKVAPPAAVEAALEELPHLRAETIELVMLDGAETAPNPIEVFRRASVAAQRGRSLLLPAAAAELDGMIEALAGELSVDGVRLRAYFDRVRRGVATATYEDQEAAWLTARAARRLSPERLERLRNLMAGAVRASLPPAQ